MVLLIFQSHSVPLVGVDAIKKAFEALVNQPRVFVVELMAASSEEFGMARYQELRVRILRTLQSHRKVFVVCDIFQVEESATEDDVVEAFQRIFKHIQSTNMMPFICGENGYGLFIGLASA